MAGGISLPLTVCIPHNGQTTIYGKRSCTVGIQCISSGYQVNVGTDERRSMSGLDVTPLTFAYSLKVSEDSDIKHKELQVPSLLES
jgi:hypothetical protein